jgi:hypothetical protein
MKILKVLTISILLLAISNSYSQDYSRKAFASVHYYAEQMLGCKIVENKEDVDLRKGILYYYAVKDIAGNYGHISGGYTGDYYVSLWKMDNGNDLIGFTHFNCEASCLYECSFYESNLESMNEVTTEIFPVKKMTKHMNKMKKKVLGSGVDIQDPKAQFKFILPHGHGLLSVYLSIDNNKLEFPLLELEWNGEEFQIHTKYKEIAGQ